MFRNKSAWFSSSVSPACYSFWTLEGGSVAGWTTADYLFSEDAACPDTLRIYESKDYLWNKVVVFHSLFLSTCEKRRSVKSVYIGHYVLPPLSVQAEVRNVVGRLIWENDDGKHVSSGPLKRCQTKDDLSEKEVSRNRSEPSDSDSPETGAPRGANMQDYLLCNKNTGYISMDSLQKYSGDLRDYRPRCFPCANCKAHCCLQHA